MTTIGTGLQLRSLIKKEGMLELSLVEVPTPRPEPDEVVVRIDACPINPSDLGLLLGGADLSTLEVSGTTERPVMTAKVPPAAMKAMAGRVDRSLTVGGEGAGVVVQAGASPEAQALTGKTVAIYGGAMFAQYRCIESSLCLVLPPGTTPAEGASCYVNPLTALGMLATMRAEGHRALVHTAAASNLGQMLQRVCNNERVDLVNIVRKESRLPQLKALGATHVCNSTSASFTDELTEALVATGATIAFDAVGGGSLASQILSAMEAALGRSAKGYNRYGSAVHKQVYVYGMLNASPTQLTRTYGMAWGVGGWLLSNFLDKIGPESSQKLRERVATEIKTTFASTYAKELRLRDLLRIEELLGVARQATGEKCLIKPNEATSPVSS